MYPYELLKPLNRKDLRSVVKWCKKNGVTIHKDSTGEFVIKCEFDLAYDKPLILDLQAKHGKEWQVMYEAYISNELHKFLDTESKTRETKPRYIPKGSIESKQKPKGTQ